MDPHIADARAPLYHFYLAAAWGPLGLDRESSLIVVGFAVHQQYRFVNFIRVKERRDVV